MTAVRCEEKGDKTFGLLKLWDPQDSRSEIEKMLKISSRSKKKICKDYSTSNLSVVSEPC